MIISARVKKVWLSVIAQAVNCRVNGAGYLGYFMSFFNIISVHIS